MKCVRVSWQAITLLNDTLLHAYSSRTPTMLLEAIEPISVLENSCGFTPRTWRDDAHQLCSNKLHPPHHPYGGTIWNTHILSETALDSSELCILLYYGLTSIADQRAAAPIHTFYTISRECEISPLGSSQSPCRPQTLWARERYLLMIGTHMMRHN